MKHRDVNVLDILGIVEMLNRAGQHPGKTNVAKLARITIPRAGTLLTSAQKSRLITTYGNQYRSNVSRRCYMVTQRGYEILEVIRRSDDHMSWIAENSQSEGE